MIVKAYVIRHQRLGFLMDRVYAKPPSNDEFRARTASLGEGWSKVVPIELELPDNATAAIAVFDPWDVPVAPPVAAVDQHFKVEVSAKGMVTPPVATRRRST
jgi:hypothetical protein